MTEYELVDAIGTLNSNLVQGQALTISILTAYMVVAYTTGKDLTQFQVVFISIVLSIFGALGFQSQLYHIDEIINYSSQLFEMRGAEPTEGWVASVATWQLIALRIFLFGGALTFMWRIRHPKY